ncbi:hypothetical protein ACLKA7_017394 [Drosophila subpalustris]
MDTVYGTKKYFQSLSGVSDIYRTQTCRQMNTSEYNYQNTLGRRSQLGAYYHMNKQPSYTNDHSINSQYGYNTWGIWRDGRNIAPSTFSTKTHAHYPKNRSFSIILTTAAFIVLLAVISIAGLAFYFSSIKATLEDPVLGFEGSFRIAKGDLYSTGLKYNHTTTYKQKIDFYKRFVERALTDNGLQPLRTDVWGFGEGPLIKVSFRIFLDVRKLPQNILSVEEYIKESLFLETAASKSLYRSIRLDSDSMEIKRILDEQIVRSASILKEAQTVPTSQTQLEKRLMKKGGGGGGAGGGGAPLPTKPSTVKPKIRAHSPDDEPDIDVENAPVIQGSFEGSFEITKTDADIAQRKKATPTRSYQSSSLPPKTIAVTPYSLRVKPKKPSIEKLTTITPREMPTTTTTKVTTRKPKITSTAKTTTTRTTTTTTTPPPPPASSSTTPPPPPTPPSTTTPPPPSSSSTTPPPPPPTSSTTPPPPPPPSSSTTPPPPPPPPTPSSTPPPPPTPVLPKLDANLFTTFPILDTQPWRPIHREVPELLPGPPPAFPTKTLPAMGVLPVTTPTPTPTANHMPQRRIDELELPFMPDHPTPPAATVSMSAYGKHKPPEATQQDSNPDTDTDMLFYHNFGNPVFLPGTENIERLGGALVEAHPLPVPLIDDVLVPPFRPIDSTLNKLQFHIEGNNQRFEHLGGGVIAKKQETEVETETEQSSTVSATPAAASVKPTENSVLADTIGEFFMELLNLPKEDNSTTTTTTTPEPIESRIEPEESPLPKPNFMNLKEIILQRNTTTTTTSTPTKKQRIRPSSEKPTMLDDSNLFPSHSKWEFVNSSAPLNFGYNGNMRKVFNKTLQAWVSEDVAKTENLTLHDIKTRINNASNIQDISLIFDTLASKLGITPSASTKLPPFSPSKLKHNPLKLTTTTESSVLAETSVKNFIELPLQQQREPFIKPMSSFMDDGSSEVLGAAIPVVGEAEVEVIDPLKYEELLKTSQFAVESTSTEPSAHRLVTLLPVRSNSGIRTYKPISGDSQSETLPVSGKPKVQSNIRRKSSVNQSRRFGQPPAEAVVKGGIKVTAQK